MRKSRFSAEQISSKRPGNTVLTEGSAPLGLGQRGVYLVGEFVGGPSMVDGRVEPFEQLLQRFARSPLQHRQAVVIIVGDGHALDGIQRAQRELPAVVDQRRDIRQREARGGAGRRSYAAWRSSAAGALARFHGNSSSTRVIGCSAMRSSTSRRYASGSRPFSLAVPIRL